MLGIRMSISKNRTSRSVRKMAPAKKPKAKRRGKISVKSKPKNKTRPKKASSSKYPRPLALLPAKRSKGKWLPRTLSGWIVEAVKDVKKFEKDKNFVLDMNSYNSYYLDPISPDKICHVCMGGAAIVGAGLVRPGTGTNGDYSSNVAHALDSVRTGYLICAINHLYGYYGYNVSKGLDVTQPLEDKLTDLDNWIICNLTFTFKGHAPWEVYLKVAEELKKIGL